MDGDQPIEKPHADPASQIDPTPVNPAVENSDPSSSAAGSAGASPPLSDLVAEMVAGSPVETSD
jgi:hypothetical protein